jgi:Uma2 family endonuclease
MDVVLAATRGVRLSKGPMPTPLTHAPEMISAQMPPRKRWTREECAVFEASGLFEKEPLELVGGELISKMGKNRPHVNAFRLMLIWLQKTFGSEFVDPEAPIDVNPNDNPSSEPQPDLIVLNRECATFVSGNPQPEDIRLLVEISDSTLDFDLSVKAILYARASIVEYWVFDVSGRRLISHRKPEGGRYGSVTIYSEHELIVPLAAPEAEFCAAQALSG